MTKKLAFVILVLAVIAIATPIFANPEEGAAAGSLWQRDMWKFIGAAFVLGIAAFAGAFGQAKAINAACISMGRNPGAAGPVRITMLIGIAFIESLVIYAFVIAFMILNK